MTVINAPFTSQECEGALPYASVAFGVYQPLLGWKSTRHARRFALASAVDHLALLETLAQAFSPTLTYDNARDGTLHLASFNPGRPLPAAPASPSLLVTALRADLQSQYGERCARLSDAELSAALSLSAVTRVLKDKVTGAVNATLSGNGGYKSAGTQARATMAYEARLAASLLQLADAGQFTAVRNLLFPPDWQQAHHGARAALNRVNPLQQYVPLPGTPFDQVDPAFDLDRLALSPIGIVHLFREYFFERDTCLGNPIGHVCVGPGASVALCAVSTVAQDLPAAVEQDNARDIRRGASGAASYTSAAATAQVDLHETDRHARARARQQLRQQSTRLAAASHAGCQTTFKPATGTSDGASQCFALRNDTATMQHYALRRKLRQVAVEVHDAGTWLCWQTFVDAPGRALDLAHLDSGPDPDEPAPMPMDDPGDFPGRSGAVADAAIGVIWNRPARTDTAGGALRERGTRPAADLREEERVALYRQLIEEMLQQPGGAGAAVPQVRVDATLATRHVLAELIASMFDVDRMLYFLAPECWTPRARASRQPATARPGSVSGSVSGSASGSATGSAPRWRLQPDGDDQRNAFLNAPWVKAVLPIRPGKEAAAIDWLKHVEGVDGIGSDDLYTGAGAGAGKDASGRPLVDVLARLATAIADRHGGSMAPGRFELHELHNPHHPHDPARSTRAPVDAAAPARHGAVLFQTVDQWVERLPTDQVVPVEVAYDPHTGCLKKADG